MNFGMHLKTMTNENSSDHSIDRIPSKNTNWNSLHEINKVNWELRDEVSNENEMSIKVEEKSNLQQDKQRIKQRI